MDTMLNNWFIFIALACVAGVGAVYAIRFAAMPTDEQLEKVREWLLWAVTQAEKELGGGTGQLKLRSVYDLFVQRFPWLAKIISFDYFAELVDEALVEMRDMLAKNEKVQAIVQGGEYNADRH